MRARGTWRERGGSCPSCWERRRSRGLDYAYLPVSRKAFEGVMQREIEIGAAEPTYNKTGRVTGKTYKGGQGAEDLTQEKADAYFSGEKSVEEVIDVVQNRVQLYLDERKKRK